MKAKVILSFLVFFTILSCSDKNHFRQFDRLPENHRWELSDKKTFEVEISDDSKVYNLIFLFSHVSDYQFNSVPIHIEIESPDGKIEKIDKELTIKDAEGKQIADCSGDICDLKFSFKENTKLQKGNYKITLSHSFKGPYLPNVLGIGLEIDPVK